MQFDSRFIDDLARVASGALGVATGVREEVEARLRQQFERLIEGMDLVPRDEFEAVKAMAAEARAENERLGKRLAALEAALAAGGAQTGRKKPAKAKKAKKPKAAKPRPAKDAPKDAPGSAS